LARNRYGWQKRAKEIARKEKNDEKMQHSPRQNHYLAGGGNARGRCRGNLKSLDEMTPLAEGLVSGIGEERS